MILYMSLFYVDAQTTGKESTRLIRDAIAVYTYSQVDIQLDRAVPI